MSKTQRAIKFFPLHLPVSSIRSRLIAFLLFLLLPVLGATYTFISGENERYTDQTIDSYLGIGAEVFDFSRTEHINTLLTISSALTRDWGFRNAFGAADEATILDAAQNLLSRSFQAADMMLIADMDGKVITDTAAQGFTELRSSWLTLMERAAASSDGVAEAVLTVNDIPYQVTVIPLFLPAPVAWIFAGFPLDGRFVASIKQSSASDVSVLRFQGLDLSNLTTNSSSDMLTQTDRVTGQVIASTLSGDDARLTLEGLDPTQFGATQRIRLQEADYGTLVRPLAADPASGELILAVIQRSYRENQVNLAQLQDRLFSFSMLVVSISLLAVIWLARTFTRPILALAKRVKSIEQGDYATGTSTQALAGGDELTQLDRSVSAMARGLAEREKIRDLLGKVVSPEIAAELMDGQIELGGEERIVSVLFADIRGFTTLSEKQTPSQTLHMLNQCFEKICLAIESCGGVVDKFNGDAVMALFGAPVSHANDADRAMHALLNIEQALRELSENPDSPTAGLSIGLGIHTGLVVAGNMGSQNRMNYTVIGDSVNLASRLESLTRLYGVSNLVSEASVKALGKDADKYQWLELDVVRVKGKREPVRIFSLLGLSGSLTVEKHAQIELFRQMRQHYERAEWDTALAILHTLIVDGDHPLFSMYQERIVVLKQTIHSPWDAVFNLESK
ncbi:adenylate/guanylate cyclase domain-containing protein [Gammaproteobacteria bacterium LSUCC0112]|nr:adenylate/guanylate cyclase domain-containing protein [Gammaproteobacteria bacterium LSUCC0112]